MGTSHPRLKLVPTYPENGGLTHSPWFRESVLPRGELDVPDSGAEGVCVSGSVFSSLLKRLRLGSG